MANIKSSKKRAITNEQRKLRNNAWKSEIKTITKKVIAALQNKELETVKGLLKTAVSKIARAKGKGVFKRNTAIRKISKISKKVALVEKGLLLEK